MHAWETIQKTLNHIEAHIGDDIQIEELAEIAALSLFYYQRLFSRLAKKPIREYIKLRRLARACDMLRDKENRIIDVAMAYGFGGRETFTRAFKEAYGISPAQYREHPVDLNHFIKPDLQLKHTMVDEGVPLISDGLVLEFTRRTLAAPMDFLGAKDYFAFKRGKMLGERTGVSTPGVIWERLYGVLDDIPRVPGGWMLGVTYHGDAADGYTTYFAGVEVAPGTEDERFAKWQLPAREYVICRFESEDDGQLFAALGKAMQFTRAWLKQHGLIADGFFPEIYPHSAPDIASMEMWVPFRQREINE